MKKVLAILLSIILVISILPISSLSANAETSGYYTYEVTNERATITKCSTAISGSVTIPDTLGGYPVTSIGKSAFFLCQNLTSITIPDSVTSIGEYAFGSCRNLTSITIGNSVTSIGDHAFYNCGLTNIELPNSITNIGEYAFTDCINLTSIIIPDSVTSIGNAAFYNTAYYNNPSNWEDDVIYIGKHLISLKTSISGAYTIKNGTKTIAFYAFYNCDNITSITIPDSVTSIGNYVFYNCKSLTSITIPNSVTSIGKGAFRNCDSLTSINIPNSVTSIGDDAFHDCASLTSVTIGDSVTHIGINAFSYCPSLTSVTIGNSVTYIDNHAFRNCSKLKSITIPNSVTSIGDYAFWDCTSLSSITIGNGIKSISEAAFGYCYNLTNVNISDIVAWCNISFDPYYGNPLSYAQNLYLNDELVTDLVIPDGATRIGDTTFSSYNNLTSITIPNSVTSIGEQAFYNCNNITSITIPDSVTSIGVNAFSYCDNITSVTIGNSVTSIGNSAFSNCKSLTSITIPNSVTSIGNSVFYNCKSLTSITIPNSVTSIGEKAFYNCGLTNIKLPNSVTNISERAFDRCYSIEKVYYCGTTEQWIKISIGYENASLVNATRYYHLYDNDCDTDCNICGNTRITAHEIPDEWTIRIVSTCIQKGEKYKICSICEEEETAEIEINPNNHNYATDGKCEWCNNYVESKHKYDNFTDETWTIYRKSAESITITFSADTFVEKSYDYIYIYDGANENPIGEYTGNSLASKSITVRGDTVKIRLKTDQSNAYYGFKITDISAEYVLGDLNGDSEVDVLDLIKLKNILLGDNQTNGASPDVNNDGLTNSEDLVFLRKYLFANY